MAKDPAIENQPVKLGVSPEAGKPDKLDDYGNAPDNLDGDNPDLNPDEVDRGYWIRCLEDAERAEKSWRSRARDIIEIYRNEGPTGRGGKIGSGPITYNILYANTEVMLPAVYQKPAKPVVRSRFTKVATPMPPTPPPLPPTPPSLAPPPGGAAPPGGPPGPQGAPPEPPPGPIPAGPPPGVSLPNSIPGGPFPPPGMPPEPIPPMMDTSPLAMAAVGGAPPGPPLPAIIPGDPGTPPPSFGALPGAPPPPMPSLPQPAPSRPGQQAIETAASVMEKALEVVSDDEYNDEAAKLAIKDMLLPGRGVARVRWKPEMKQQPVTAGDGITPLPHPTDPTQQLTQEVKVWEEVGDEYVYWEDLLVDPVRIAGDMDWIAFRHLFTPEALEGEFGDSPQYQALKAQGRLGDIIKWTEESAAKAAVGGGSAMKTSAKLGDTIKKAMAWEIWDRRKRRVIWFIREVTGLVLRIDPDPLQLIGFYPIPTPMLSIRTSDSRIPRPFYDLYSKLAADLDETSERISAVTKQIKIRGGYNSASKEIAEILRAKDQTMIPIDGVDMLNGGLQNHIWLVPVVEWVKALQELYIARDQIKQGIYEVMGISDIMRGATKASETATAQRIKGSMGVSRLEDAKQQVDNFCRDLLRLKAEIIGQNFDAATLEAMTGEQVTPEVLAILRSDFQRTCNVDIESDSTIQVDEQAEQQAMAMVMQSVQAVMQGAQSMLATGILPPPQVMQLSLEMLKMFLHPVRYSRGVVEMIDDFQEQLQQQVAMQAMMPPMPPPGAGPPGAPPPGPGGPGGPPVAPGRPPVGLPKLGGGGGGAPPPPPPGNAHGPPPLQ